MKSFDPEEEPLYPLQWHLNNTGSTRSSVAGYDINLERAWLLYSGEGRLIGIIDTGVDETHPDLIANYRRDLSWNLPANKPGASPHESDDSNYHGTAVAGLIAASANGIGVVGVAYEAQFIMYRRDFKGPGEGGQFRLAADRMLAEGVEINNNSWGAGKPFDYIADQAQLHAASRELATVGRDGLGMITVFSVGNSRMDGGDGNYNPISNSPWVIGVAASDQAGGLASYSSPGANVLVSAPGSDPASIITTDRLGEKGTNPNPSPEGDYNAGNNDAYAFNGTSAAAPIVSGVVALMLEANERLGYRDVQEILVYSARRATFLDRETIHSQGGKFNSPLDKAFNGSHDWNGGALLVSHDFGYGHIDADAAVRLAESWMSLGTAANLVIEEGQVAQRTLAVAAGQQGTVTAGFSAPYRVEQITLTFDMQTTDLPAVTLELISPDGTVSRLINKPVPVLDDETGRVALMPERLDGYVVNTVQHWGEGLAGTWSLRITNASDTATVQLEDWAITAYTAGEVEAARGVQIFTNEFVRFADEDPGRAVIDPANGATLNAAAVTFNIGFDLSGTYSGINKTPMQFLDPHAFRNLISGDGDDTLVGNAADNILMPGRGQNYIHGNAGLDAVRLLGEYQSYTFEQVGDAVRLTNPDLDLGDDEALKYWDGLRGVEVLRFDDRVMLLNRPEVSDSDGFDEAAYLAQYPDVASAVTQGLLASGRQHYFEWGRLEGRNPNNLFSEAWYLEQNADVADAVAQGRLNSGFDHYQKWGWAEGRAPSLWMDTTAYLGANPDVAAAGVDPLLHYLVHGYEEGRLIKSLDVTLWV